MLHLSKRAFLSSFICCLTVLTLSGAGRAQQAPSATSSSTPGSATPTVKQRSAGGASVADRFLSQTTARLQSADTANNVYHYVLTFPSKTTANFTITLQLNQLYRPTAKDLRRRGGGIELYGVSASSDAASRSTTVRVFLPYRSLPPDAVKRLHASLPTAPTSDATRAITQLMSYRYFSVAYQGYGQAGAPASGVTELQGFWASFVVELLKGMADPAVEESIQNGLEEIQGAGKAFTAYVSSLIGVLEAGMLNAEDTALLAKIMAIVDCAGNPLSQGLQNAPAPNPYDQPDQLGSDAKAAVALQFGLLMAKVAVDLAGTETAPGLGVLGGALVAGAADKASEMLAQDLQDTLHKLQLSAPSCQPTLWWGDYEIVGTPLQATGWSFTNEGNLQFSVTDGRIKGVVEGHLKGHTGVLNCTVYQTYTGQLTGYSTMQAPYYDAHVSARGRGSSSATGTMPDGSPCPAGPPRPISVSLFLCLVDGHTHRYDQYSDNLACSGADANAFLAKSAAAAQDENNQHERGLGYSGRVTVTVKKVQ
jgi:hypothetical protein